MHSLSGDNTLKTEVSKEWNAPCSEMSQLTKVRNSFDKRTELLIASGLICGTIPRSMRKRSNHGILGIVSSALDGGDGDTQETVS